MTHRYTKFLLTILLITFFSSRISGGILQHYVMKMTLVDFMQDSMLVTLKYFGEYCSLIWVSLLIWLGTYYSLSGKRRILAVVGLTLGLAFAESYGFHLLSARHISLEAVQFDNNWVSSNAKNIEADISNEKAPLRSRSDLSLGYARLAFQQTGKIHSYLDVDGATKQYVPTQHDIDLRKDMQDISNV